MAASKIHRWNHVFKDDGRTLIVAMDHAGAFGLMEGLEKPGEVLRKVRAGGADAVLTTYGVVTKFEREIGDLGIVLRVDGGSTMLAKQRGPQQLMHTAEDALRVGADAVGSMGMPGSCFESEQLPYLADLVNQCAEWGLPVMAEMLPAGFENPAEWWTPQNMGHACRIGAELGVDFIKTNYTGDIESFRTICEQVYVPIVVLGGGKSKDSRDLLQGIYDALQAGASGVAVGRNIYRHDHPDKITAAIAALIHKNATVEEAMDYLK
jgi:DhnA family fructose-bisphosphate aldolase class Ia